MASHRIEHKFTADQAAGFVVNGVTGVVFSDVTEVFYCGVLLDDVVDYTQTATQITFIIPFKAGEDIAVVTPAPGSPGGSGTIDLIIQSETLDLSIGTTELNLAVSEESAAMLAITETPLNLEVNAIATNIAVANEETSISIGSTPLELTIASRGAQGPQGPAGSTTQTRSTVFALLRTSGTSISITKYEAGDTVDVATLVAAGNILVDGLENETYAVSTNTARTLQRIS